MVLRSLQTPAKCRSLRLAPKWHGITSPLLSLLHSAYLLRSIIFDVVDNQTASAATALELITYVSVHNLCKTELFVHKPRPTN